MIFYRRNADGAWCGTQAEAGKDRIQVDVPTDKPNLLVFLNEHCREMVSPEPEPDPSGDRHVDAPADLGAGSHSDQGLALFDLAKLVSNSVEDLGQRGDAAFEAVEEYQSLFGVGAAFSRGVHILNLVAAGEHQLTRIFLGARRKKFGLK